MASTATGLGRVALSTATSIDLYCECTLSAGSHCVKHRFRLDEATILVHSQAKGADGRVDRRSVRLIVRLHCQYIVAFVVEGKAPSQDALTTARAASRAPIRSASIPHAPKASIECSPGRGGGSESAAGVWLKRGAGAG